MTFPGLTLNWNFLVAFPRRNFPVGRKFFYGQSFSYRRSMAGVYIWTEFHLCGQSFSLVKVFSMAGVFLWSEFCEKFPMTRVFSYVSPITGVHPRPQFPYGQGISIGRSTFPMGKVTSWPEFPSEFSLTRIGAFCLDFEKKTRRMKISVSSSNCTSIVWWSIFHIGGYLLYFFHNFWISLQPPPLLTPAVFELRRLYSAVVISLDSQASYIRKCLTYSHIIINSWSYYN